jgi:hypothetical protein
VDAFDNRHCARAIPADFGSAPLYSRKAEKKVKPPGYCADNSRPMNEDSVQNELLRLKEAGLYRALRRVEGEQGPTLILDGQEVINFSSNNYLGIANQPVWLWFRCVAVDFGEYGPA